MNTQFGKHIFVVGSPKQTWGIPRRPCDLPAQAYMVVGFPIKQGHRRNAPNTHDRRIHLNPYAVISKNSFKMKWTPL